MNTRFHLVCWWTCVCVALVGLVGCASGTTSKEPGKQPGKIRIAKLDDLPQHTYPITGTVTELVKSSERIRALAVKVRADIEADLDKYQIDDATTLQRMYSTLMRIALIEKNYDAALGHIAQVRELEDKEATKHMIGLRYRAMITARRQVGENAPEDKYQLAFSDCLADLVGALPWKVCQDKIRQNKASAEIFTENLLLGLVKSQMEPVVAQTDELSGEMAARALSFHLAMRDVLPLKEKTIAVYQAKIDIHKEVKADIWAARSVALAKNKNHQRVLLGVWDSGTDPKVFKPNLFVNPNEKFDGRDTDGNGYIDDVHGIAFDLNARRTTGLLFPLGEAAERIPQIMDYMKGLIDLEAAIDSPEATALKRHIGSLEPDEVQGFIEDLSLAGSYVHGTHVAGIMTAGNPFADLLIARLSYDFRTIPVARTLEWGRRDAAKCRATVEYFKQHGVRVVNMSWGEAQKDVEVSLEKNGIGDNAEQRRDLARQVFALQKEGLYEAIKNAPEILFVCAAGNADNDVEFDEYIASSFDLPNLLVAGAVDQAGEPTSFTSFGRTVKIYANGFEVDSYIPGGERLKLSGTSMSAPNAANLAGKLLTIKPNLKPTEVIEYILAGADRKSAGEHSFLLMNPKQSVQLLQERLRQ